MQSLPFLATLDNLEGFVIAEKEVKYILASVFIFRKTSKTKGYKI